MPARVSFEVLFTESVDTGAGLLLQEEITDKRMMAKKYFTETLKLTSSPAEKGFIQGKRQQYAGYHP